MPLTVYTAICQIKRDIQLKEKDIYRFDPWTKQDGRHF